MEEYGTTYRLSAGNDSTTLQGNNYFFRGNCGVMASQAEKTESRRGIWYVRNAAKANRKPHTPVSNKINASSFSGARGKSDRETQSTD